MVVHRRLKRSLVISVHFLKWISASSIENAKIQPAFVCLNKGGQLCWISSNSSRKGDSPERNNHRTIITTSDTTYQKSSSALFNTKPSFSSIPSGGSILDTNYFEDDRDAELPLSFPRRDDVLAALTAVRKASSVIRNIQPERALDKSGSKMSVTKSDASPVTVGDFSAQAIVLRHLHKAFPTDSFIAEESSKALVENPSLAQDILEATMVQGIEDIDDLMASIDLGQTYNDDGSDSGTRSTRTWCLDPIDGTKGFLRGKRDGGQYCVALALVEDGVPTIGVLGCPNLPTEVNDENYEWRDDETEETNANARGCIFVASKGGGAYQLPLFPNKNVESKRLHVTPVDGERTPKDARFCVGKLYFDRQQNSVCDYVFDSRSQSWLDVTKGVEKFSDPLGQLSAMAEILHGKDEALDDEGVILKARRMDSQVKYGVLSRGGGELFARLPRPGYLEWIWDHAAGSVVIQEAGGQVTDVDGNAIDFGLGAKLSKDVRGILASNGGQFHEKLLEAYKLQEQQHNESKT